MIAKFSNNNGKVIVNGVEIIDSESWKKVIDSIKELEQENQQLKIQISAREKNYKKLEKINKVLSQELTKDSILKQDHLTTCCGIPIGDIPELIDKNKKLEDSWNKLKEYIDKTKFEEFEKSYGKRYGKTFTQAEIIVCNMIKNKIKELERGVSDE